MGGYTHLRRYPREAIPTLGGTQGGISSSQVCTREAYLFSGVYQGGYPLRCVPREAIPLGVYPGVNSLLLRVYPGVNSLLLRVYLSG